MVPGIILMTMVGSGFQVVKNGLPLMFNGLITGIMSGGPRAVQITGVGLNLGMIIMCIPGWL
jgi:hypothetical protein